jgi:hypothetical protein
MLHLFSLFSMLYRGPSYIQRSAVYLLLGIGISLLFFTHPVQSSETILLQYRDLRLSIPRAELKAFVTEQETSPELQQFLQDTNQDPNQVKQWLTAEITRPQATRQISSDFVLLQINKIIGDPSGRETLAPLRTALGKTLEEDNTFSILEILENYPQSRVRLELSRLGQAYSDVNLLVTRISPVLEVVEALLPELICDCTMTAETTAKLSSLDSSQATIAPLQRHYRQTRDALYSLLPASVSEFSHLDPKALASKSLEPETPNPAPVETIAVKPSDSPDLANKTLVFRFGAFGRSISMRDLTYFAETGKLPAGWRFFFNLAGVDAKTVRTALNQKVSVSLKFLDQTLNNLLGEFLLYQVGQIIQTPSNTANIQALRSASILSVAEDNHLSMLEVLQQYPTRQVYVNGLRLARLGRNVSRFQAQGGVETALINLEDWLVQLQASVAENLCACEEQSGNQSGTGFADSPPPTVMTPPTISPTEIAKFLPPNWQPVAPHREDHGILKVVWLQGTPYEMGYQHGQYLHEEIASLPDEVLEALRFAGRGLALGRLAARRSYPEIWEECQGVTEATQDIGMTMEACLVLSYGDVYQAIFGTTLPDVLFWEGCSQWVATGEATKEGRLYHGSTLDNNEKPVDFIVNNPVIFVRQPNDGLPHVFITYPGVVWPNWGLNVAGITLGLDTVHAAPHELSFEGGSNVQIMAKILKTATSFAEARQIMETQPRVHANLIMITDGKSKEAGVFEFTGKSLGVRELPDSGVLYMTNHMVSEELFDRQRFPLSESSLSRFDRFAQLMEPDGIQSYYGEIDPAVMVKIGRDRINPTTLEASPLHVFDDDASPGGNGSLRQGLYDPEKLLLWVAAGRPPVPENPFVCFSLGEMLGFPNAAPCESPAL